MVLGHKHHVTPRAPRCPCVDDIMPLLKDGDPLGVEGFATHQLPLEEGAHGYEIFQKKEDNAIRSCSNPDL